MPIKSPLSSWYGTAERNLGEIHPLQVPMMPNNLSTPPQWAHHMGRHVPKRSIPAVWSAEQKPGGSKHPPEAVNFVTLIPLFPTWQKMEYMTPKLCSSPPKVSCTACVSFTCNSDYTLIILSALPPDLRPTTEQPDRWSYLRPKGNWLLDFATLKPGDPCRGREGRFNPPLKGKQGEQVLLKILQPWGSQRTSLAKTACWDTPICLIWLVISLNQFSLWSPEQHKALRANQWLQTNTYR